jgi:hypothetical protein
MNHQSCTRLLILNHAIDHERILSWSMQGFFAYVFICWHKEASDFTSVICLLFQVTGVIVSSQILCSRRRFGEHQAESWWNENRDKVYEKYNVRSSERVSSASSIRSGRWPLLRTTLPCSGHQKTSSGSAEPKSEWQGCRGILFCPCNVDNSCYCCYEIESVGLVRLSCSDVMHIELWNTETCCRGWGGSRGWTVTVARPALYGLPFWKPWL